MGGAVGQDAGAVLAQALALSGFDRHPVRDRGGPPLVGHLDPVAVRASRLDDVGGAQIGALPEAGGRGLTGDRLTVHGVAVDVVGQGLVVPVPVGLEGQGDDACARRGAGDLEGTALVHGPLLVWGDVTAGEAHQSLLGCAVDGQELTTVDDVLVVALDGPGRLDGTGDLPRREVGVEVEVRGGVLAGVVLVARAVVVLHRSGGGIRIGHRVVVVIRDVREATDVGAVVGVAGGVDDVTGGEDVVGVAVAVGHVVDVPGDPVQTHDAFEGAEPGVARRVQALLVSLDAHDRGLSAGAVDHAGGVVLAQGAVLLEDGDPVTGLVTAPDGLEGPTDGHGRAVNGLDDAAHVVVVDLRREARQLLVAQVERGDALAGRGVDLGEGSADVQGLPVRRDAQGLDAAVGRGAQRSALAIGCPDRSDTPGGLVVQRRELPAQVEGLAVGGGGNGVDGAIGGGRPVEDLTGVDVVGHRVAAWRLILAGRRSCRPDRGELPDGVDDVPDHDLVPDNAIDLGGGQGIGGDGVGSTGSAGGGGRRVRGGRGGRSERDGTDGNESRGQQAAQESAGELHRYSIQNILRSRTRNLTNGWYSAPDTGRRAGSSYTVNNLPAPVLAHTTEQDNSVTHRPFVQIPPYSRRFKESAAPISLHDWNHLLYRHNSGCFQRRFTSCHDEATVKASNGAPSGSSSTPRRRPTLTFMSNGRRLDTDTQKGGQHPRRTRPGSACGPPEGGGSVVRTQIDNDLDISSPLRRDDEGSIHGHRLTGCELGRHRIRGRDDLGGGGTRTLAVVDGGGQHAGQRQLLTGPVRHRHWDQDTSTSHLAGTAGEVLRLHLPQGDHQIPINTDGLVQAHLRVLILRQIPGLNGLGVDRGGIRGGDVTRGGCGRRRRFRGLDRRCGDVRGGGLSRGRTTGRGRGGGAGSALGLSASTGGQSQTQYQDGGEDQHSSS